MSIWESYISAAVGEVSAAAELKVTFLYDPELLSSHWGGVQEKSQHLQA